MKKLMLLAAAAVGYVLGTKAGRERYEQIRGSYRAVRNNPRVQQAAASAAETAKDQAPVVAEKASGLAASAKGKVGDKVGGHSDSDQEDLVTELHPDSTARQEDPYPKGDLP